MFKKIFNILIPSKSKFKRGDKVSIDKKFIKSVYGYTFLDMEYTGTIVKSFLASENTHIYLVKLNFQTGFREYNGEDERLWFNENKLNFVSTVDDRDYKINILLNKV